MEFKRFNPTPVGPDPSITVLIPTPDKPRPHQFVGKEQLLNRCQAAWMSGPGEHPLHFCLVGPPGVGKNHVVYELARRLRKDLYIIQGHEEMTPVDMACSARITEAGQVQYVGSPLLAAMIHGGVCFFDEINRVPTRSLSLLGEVLDTRRTLTSLQAGVSVQAHPEFRFCAAMNDADASANTLPSYIQGRTKPAFRVEYPTPAELFAIVKASLPEAAGVLMNRFRAWAISQLPDRPISPRVALTIMEYVHRLHRHAGGRRLTAVRADQLIAHAARAVLDGA